MTLEDMLDDYEDEFKGYLDELEQEIEENYDGRIQDIVSTQNELLILLYDAVTYAHESDYPSHFSSEIKKVNKIVENFQDDSS